MASSQDDGSLSALARDVVEGAKLPAKSRSLDLKPTVARLASALYEQGALPDTLGELVDLITVPSHLDQASLNAILRSLYPATRVTADIVVRVVASLGHGQLKPSLTLQAALIRWIILVYHVLKSPEVLSQTYHVLFGLLDTAALRPQLSHLLALVTRRKHVKPFRIQYLMNLSRQTGNDPCLVGLLRVFKDYYPEIIVGDAIRGKAAAFKHPDPQWRSRLDEIQEAHLQSTLADQAFRPRDGFRVNRPIGRRAQGGKLPVVRTSHAGEASITLEEVEDASGLARGLGKLELPNQLVAVLADPLLQKLLVLRPRKDAYERIANWLGDLVQDVVNGGTTEGTLWDVVDVVKDFVTLTRTLPPVLLNFFSRFFEVWDGSGARDSLFEILAYAPFHDFEELYQHIYQPFESAVLAHQPDCHASILSMYSKLLNHWTVVLLAGTDIPDGAAHNISTLVLHVNSLAQTVLQASPSVKTDAIILDFYEQTLRPIKDGKLLKHIRIELPPSPLIYTLLFSNSLSTQSSLCRILALYKKGFETSMSKRAGGYAYDKDYVNLYNGFLMDICNCFWRSRAFSRDEANAKGCMIPGRTITALKSYVASVDSSFSLASLFGLSHSPTLCNQSIQLVRDLEDEAMAQGASILARHAGPVTQASLVRLESTGGLTLSWQAYRVKVLQGLMAKGVPGVAELLKSTMTVLRNALDGTGGSGS